jgi:hypothetical protein
VKQAAAAPGNIQKTAAQLALELLQRSRVPAGRR